MYDHSTSKNSTMTGLVMIELYAWFINDDIDFQVIFHVNSDSHCYNL